jgi:peroxiredoxin
VAQLRRDEHHFVDAGASLVAIGPATPAETTTFVRDLDLPFPVLADPTLAAYRAFGLAKGTPRQVLGPAVLLAHLRGLLRGARPGRVAGDVWQLPGAFIIDRDGILRFAKPARHVGDHVSSTELLDALHSVIA